MSPDLRRAYHAMKNNAEPRHTYLDSISPLSRKTRPWEREEEKPRAIKALERIPTQRALDMSARSETWRSAFMLQRSMAEKSAKGNGRMFGCENPSVLVETDYGYAPVERHEHASSVRDLFIVHPCGRCARCIGKDTYRWVQRAKAEFLNSAECWLVTRTFGDPEPDVFKALGCDRAFRNSLKEAAKYHGRSVSVTTALEYGSSRMRKHFHDMICGADERFLREYFGGDWFAEEDLAEPSFVVFPKRGWHLGHLSVRMIADVNGAGYAAKYSLKGKSLQYGNDSRTNVERDLIRKLGDPLLRTYISTPRNPALGDEGVRKLAVEQAPRLIEDMHRVGRRNILRGDAPTGLTIDGRPMLLTPRHADLVASVVSEVFGQPVEWADLVSFDLKQQMVALTDATRGDLFSDVLTGEVFNAPDPSNVFRQWAEEVVSDVYQD